MDCYSYDNDDSKAYRGLNLPFYDWHHYYDEMLHLKLVGFINYGCEWIYIKILVDMYIELQ